MGLAARGSRETDGGLEPIEDQDLLAAVRARARRITVSALVVGLGLAALVAACPA